MQGLCSATTDEWCEKNTHTRYVSFTVQYIKDWNLISRVIFTVKFKAESPSGMNIYTTIRSKFIDVGFDFQLFPKLLFVTDQGSSVVKCLDIAGNVRFNCAAHVINLILKNAFHSPELEANVSTLISNVKSCIEYLKRSRKVLKLKRALHQSVETRFNTNYSMLHSFQIQIDDIYKVLSPPENSAITDVSNNSETTSNEIVLSENEPSTSSGIMRNASATTSRNISNINTSSTDSSDCLWLGSSSK